MNEFSESVYIRTDDRADGVRWLEDNELAGYVLEPRGDWVQVFPDWEELSDQETMALMENSSGVLVYYYFAEDQFWAFNLYHEGQLEFRYECVWLVDEYHADGVDVEEAAQILEVDAGELDAALYTGEGGGSWDERAEDAARLADLLELPNYAFASFDYVDADAEATGLDEMYVGPETGYGLHEPPTAEEIVGGEVELPSVLEMSEEPEQPVELDDDVPWKGVYELASQFLKLLHDDELIELTLDNRLARDRLIERLTNTVIENPISSDSQLLDHWFEEMMTCPEIVDIFATDEMLEEAYWSAKGEIDREIPT